ncbi:MAG TPA: hypothetical protein VGM54_00800 [Chthoniobacter sp.]
MAIRAPGLIEVTALIAATGSLASAKKSSSALDFPKNKSLLVLLTLGATLHAAEYFTARLR